MAGSSSASLTLSCSSCHMWSENPASSDSDRDSCVKCSVVTVLEARVTQLEMRIRSLEALKPSYSEVVAGTAVRSSISTVSENSPPALPVQPGPDQDRFVTVRSKRRTKTRVYEGQDYRAKTRAAEDQGHRAESREFPVQNRFAPLSWTRETLVIGSSIVRDVELPEASTRCYPGARLGDIEGNLRLLKKSKNRYRRIVIHAGGNDTRRGQSEVVKLQIAAVCALAKSMSESVYFSGPLPNYTNAEMYSRFSGVNSWLTHWCPQNGVVFIDNWRAFEGKPRLLRRDGIHPTKAGSDLLAQNMLASLR